MMMNSNPALFDGLCQRFQAHPDRRGHVHVECPSCGKEPKRGQTHFSFSERGAHCFVCGFSASLSRLAQQLQVTPIVTPVRPARVQEAPRPRYWQQNPQRFLQAFLEAPDRLDLWQQYKPLSIDTISRWRFGVGVLPSSPCSHRRLIYPLFERDRIVGFRGRAISCDCAKWISCGGSHAVCWGLDLVTTGATVLIVENPVDAALAMQEEPDVVAVASTAGAGTWREEWTARLATAQPEQVICWLDNDLAGCPNRETYRELRAAWQQAHPGMKVPEPNGPRIANALNDAGLHATVYRWPVGTPSKADLGWALSPEAAA